MTSHLDSLRTTDIKPEMLSGVQTGNGTPHDKYNIRGIAHVRTNRKDDIFMQRRLVQSFTYILEWGRGTCTLTKHTRRWTYSALQYFFYLYLVSLALTTAAAVRQFFIRSLVIKFSFQPRWFSIMLSEDLNCADSYSMVQSC